MDIELQLREHLILQDPGTPFTDTVMSRLDAEPHEPREGIVRLADERLRRRNRYILLGVLVAGAAAAMVAVVLNGEGDKAVTQLAGPSPAAPPVIATVPTGLLAIEPSATAEPEPTARPAPSTQSVAPPAATFSVRVRPLANPGNLEAGVAIAQKFRDRLITQLRAIPNLVLVDAVDGGTGTVDYEVRLRLENQPGAMQEVLGDLTAAIHMVLVDAGSPSRFTALDARIAAEAQMSPADLERSQRARQLQRFRRQTTAIMGNGNGMPMSVTLLDTTKMPAALPSASGSDPVEREAKDVVRKLRNEIFPVDAAFKQATLATLRNSTLPYNTRLTALSDLLRIEHRDEYATMDAAVIRAGADLALSEPGNVLATIAWENMLETRHSELTPQIAHALDITPDTNLRLRLIKFLASDFAASAAARKVLEVAARANGQPVVRMAALREVQGDAKWHAFVAASLVDTSLPDLQRLQPVADMADPAKTQATARLVLDDKALRELIALAGKVVGDPAASSQGFNAILALRSVDNPALADRLVEMVRAPVNERTLLTSINSRGLKTAAIGVAAVRFPEDPRFLASLKELSASSDAELSSWAKDQLEMLEASTNPEARKALLEKMMQQVLPKQP